MPLCSDFIKTQENSSKLMVLVSSWCASWPEGQWFWEVEWGDRVLLSSRNREPEGQASQSPFLEEGSHSWHGTGLSQGGREASSEESFSRLS